MGIFLNSPAMLEIQASGNVAVLTGGHLRTFREGYFSV